MWFWMISGVVMRTPTPAHRIAVRHGLARHELDALQVHADLDTQDGIPTAHGEWAARASGLRARLIPPGLDPDLLATVERHADADHEEYDHDREDAPRSRTTSRGPCHEQRHDGRVCAGRRVALCASGVDRFRREGRGDGALRG